MIRPSPLPRRARMLVVALVSVAATLAPPSASAGCTIAGCRSSGTGTAIRPSDVGRTASLELVGSFTDAFPNWGFVPSFLPPDAARYVALEEEALRLRAAGNLDAAAEAHRRQIAIYAGNPRPYVELARIEASRGRKEAAIALLREAVIRGYVDLGRLERDPAWKPLRDQIDFAFMQEVVPRLVEYERSWPSWETHKPGDPARRASALVQWHDRMNFLVAAMAPVLGEPMTSRWRRGTDRRVAAGLELYLELNPEAPDLPAAIERLTAIYARGSAFRWEVPPPDVARRLGTIGSGIVDRHADGPLRPTGLLCRAIAANAQRRGGRLEPAAATTIRAALAEILERHADSPLAAIAIDGLVRTEEEAGRTAEAATAYAAYRARHQGNEDALEAARDRLGRIGLRIGGIPPFRGTDLAGSELTHAALAGRVVVVQFWATWCKPCLDGMAVMRRIAEKQGERLVVLGVNLDRADEMTAESLRSWAARESIPGRQLFDGRGWESELVRAFDVSEIPFRAAFDATGRRIAADDDKQFEKAVQQAVAAAGGSAYLIPTTTATQTASAGADSTRR